MGWCCPLVSGLFSRQGFFPVPPGSWYCYMRSVEARKDSLLLCLIGPTASGKSTLALRIAPDIRGEIVNCDSMQMVKELMIGTAKPTREEMSQVPHHLFDLVSLSETFSAGEYMVQARKTCSEISSRGSVPVVTGGTGLYLRALLQGMFQGPPRSGNIRERLQKIADRKGNVFLHRWLRVRDPDAAGRIKTGDRVRLIRALEVVFSTGKPITSLQGDELPISGFRIVKIGLNPQRGLLYERINQRVIRMFDSGLLEETENLLRQGYDASCKGFEALGYRYAIQVLRGAMDESVAIELTQRDSRRYAKRQMTWFRREPDVFWISDTGDTDQAYKKAAELLQQS